jgi:hypothetical protein
VSRPTLKLNNSTTREYRNQKAGSMHIVPAQSDNPYEQSKSSPFPPPAIPFAKPAYRKSHTQFTEILYKW